MEVDIFCVKCDKQIKRSHKFLIDGTVEHWCYPCTKSREYIPFGEFQSYLSFLFWFFSSLFFFITVGETDQHVVCNTCSEIFFKRTCLNGHMNNVHSAEATRFPCPGCEKSYKRLDTMRDHYRKEHGDSTGNEKTTCSGCKREFCLQATAQYFLDGEKLNFCRKCDAKRGTVPFGKI